MLLQNQWSPMDGICTMHKWCQTSQFFNLVFQHGRKHDCLLCTHFIIEPFFINSNSFVVHSSVLSSSGVTKTHLDSLAAASFFKKRSFSPLHFQQTTPLFNCTIKVLLALGPFCLSLLHLFVGTNRPIKHLPSKPPFQTIFKLANLHQLERPTTLSQSLAKNICLMYNIQGSCPKALLGLPHGSYSCYLCGDRCHTPPAIAHRNWPLLNSVYKHHPPCLSQQLGHTPWAL